jgi:hypothetical protein
VPVQLIASPPPTAAAPAPAEPKTPLDLAIGMTFSFGGVITTRAVAEHFDPLSSASLGVTGKIGHLLVDASFISLAGSQGLSEGDLDAYGWSLRMRDEVLSSPAGTGFVGFAITDLWLVRPHGNMPEHAGMAWGPKLCAGVDLLGASGGFHGGLILEASYQVLLDGVDSHVGTGGMAGVELTLFEGTGSDRR